MKTHLTKTGHRVWITGSPGLYTGWCRVSSTVKIARQARTKALLIARFEAACADYVKQAQETP